MCRYQPRYGGGRSGGRPPHGVKPDGQESLPLTTTFRSGYHFPADPSGPGCDWTRRCPEATVTVPSSLRRGRVRFGGEGSRSDLGAGGRWFESSHPDRPARLPRAGLRVLSSQRRTPPLAGPGAVPGAARPRSSHDHGRRRADPGHPPAHATRRLMPPAGSCHPPAHATRRLMPPAGSCHPPTGQGPPRTRIPVPPAGRNMPPARSPGSDHRINFVSQFRHFFFDSM